MGLKEDLEKLEVQTSRLEERLKSITYERDVIAQQMNSIEILKTHLEVNLRFLKKRKVIALAMEFKKVKQDLITANTRLKSLSEDKGFLDKAIIKMDAMIKKSKDDYTQLSKKSNSKVLQGNFKGKKNGQK